jgi:hypothetical protein
MPPLWISLKNFEASFLSISWLESNTACTWLCRIWLVTVGGQTCWMIWKVVGWLHSLHCLIPLQVCRLIFVVVECCSFTLGKGCSGQGKQDRTGPRQDRGENPCPRQDGSGSARVSVHKFCEVIDFAIQRHPASNHRDEGWDSRIR